MLYQKGEKKNSCKWEIHDYWNHKKKKSTAYQTDLISAGSILVDHKQASRLVDHL